MPVAFSIAAHVRRILSILAGRPARWKRSGFAGYRFSAVSRWCGLVPLAAWILSAGEAKAEHRVLFIGNSFTYGYGSTTDVPDMFDRLARAGGQEDPVTSMWTIGGAGFEDHAGDSGTLAAINSQAWTHVVLQNYSTGPTHLNNGLGIADHLTYGRALYNQVMANHSASKVLLFETWSRAASHPLITGTSTNNTFASTTQFQNELRTNYRLLRDHLNNEFPDAPSVEVALVGSAWELAGALRPLSEPEFVDLYAAPEDDYNGIYGYHANDRGSYLAACVFYAKIYGSSPVGLHSDPLIAGLNLNFGSDPEIPASQMPAYLESVAWQMVANGTDPVTITGQPASASVPEGHPVEFQAEITGEPPFTFQWKKDGVPISGATANVLRIPAAWSSLNGAEFTVDVGNAVSLVTSQAATLTVTAGTAYSLMLDFGGVTNTTSNGASPNDPVRHWNNILPAIGTTSDGRLEGLATSQNVVTRLDLQMLSRFNNWVDSGAITNSVGLPSNATRDSLWGNTEVSNNLTDIFPRFRIAGLAPSWNHTLTFFASRTGVSDSRQTTYTVTGAGTTSVDLEAANNSSQTAALTNVVSSAAGNLEIELSPGPANNSSAHFTYLGSLQVDAEPGPPPPRLAIANTTIGSGTIAATPMQSDYAVGELVRLTAEPAPGWIFTGWSGDAAGSQNPVVMMIDADPAVTATFESQNTPPTIDSIADQMINEDTTTGSIAFTIGDAETPATLLVVNRYSSNPALVTPSGLEIDGTGANRSINVTPLPNAYGTATITISVSDGELSTQESFLLTVTPVNDAPVANDDGGTVDEGALATLDLAANDTDADDGLDLASLAIVAAPAHGNLVVNTDGTVDYTHDGSETTSDSFTYTIADLAAETSNTATVSVTVTPVNDAPVAIGQHVEVPESGSVAIDLLGSDPEGNSLDYTVQVLPSHGTLSGTMPTLTYTPNQGYHGSDSFIYVLNDGINNSAPAEVTISVISNAPPGFDEWLAGFDTTGQPVDDNDSGGLNNLIEFLFNYDPTDPADDLLFRLELLAGDGTIEVIYPHLKPVGNYHLSMAADPALLADPSSRVETITKSQIEAMTETERANHIFEMTPNGSPSFFRLEFEPPPAN